MQSWLANTRFELQASRDTFFREVNFAQTVLGSATYSPDLSVVPLANAIEYKAMFAGMSTETMYTFRVRCYNVDSFGPWLLTMPSSMVVGRCGCAFCLRLCWRA